MKTKCRYSNRYYIMYYYSTLLVADIFCFENDVMLSLSDRYQANVSESFDSISRYVDDILITDK